MVTTPNPPIRPIVPPVIKWEALPDDFQLEDEPVENTGQPLIAGALRESLELAGLIEPPRFIAGNLGICATLNDQLVIKAPDWFYVVSASPPMSGSDRRSYTPNLEGEVPRIVMEFLSATEGDEYSSKPTFPPGKWYFYEQILKVSTYVIFEPSAGVLEIYQLESGRYALVPPTQDGRYWLADIALFLGIWQGEKEGRNGYWLRWWDETGNLLPWAVEQVEQQQQQLEQERQRAEQERQRAEQERQRAEQEHQRAERLEAQLRSLGIDPEQV